MTKKRIFRMPWKTRVFLAFFFVFIMGVGAMTFFSYRGKILSRIQQQTEESLIHVSAQNILAAQEWIKDRQKLLQAAAEETAVLEEQESLEMLKKFAEIFGFYSMGIIDREGICRTTLGERLELKESAYFQEAINGKEVLTEERLSENREEWLNIFAVPVTAGEEITGVLTGVYRTGDFLEMLNIRSFHNQGGSFVVKASGELISNPAGEDREEILEIASYFQAQHWEPYGTGEGTVRRVSGEGKGYLACAQKLPVNDWSLLTYVPEDYLNRTAEDLSRNILYVLFFLYFVIVAVSFWYLIGWRRFRKEMTRVLFTDSLTGEWNEQYLHLIYHSAKTEERAGRWMVSFDIDRFQMINLLYGVSAGNRILKTVCRDFHAALPGEEIYHCQGDFFFAVIEGKSRDEICGKLQRFQEELGRKMADGAIPRFSMSFGICAMDIGNDLEQICGNAGFARQEAKEKITEKYRFYGDFLQQQLESEGLEMRFEEAVRKGEFQVWYQPKYNLTTGKICGGEALVRWKDCEGKMISPGRFIPVFESTGQIVELDEEVLRLVCRDISQAKEKEIFPGNISVNLSKLHIKKPGITDKIQSIIRAFGVSPRELSFEITESAAEGDGKKELTELVRRLQNMGYVIHMDDYGTGSSTLLSLAETEFDVLKLDRSFVSLIGNIRIDRILRSTIHMAGDLGMEVVAEGVEKKEQVDFLIRQGCDAAQGFYFSDPLPREEFFGLFRKGERGE